MEFKFNPKSSKSLDEFKADLAKEDKKREDAEKARRREMEKKQRDFDRTHGFKSRMEIIKYLKEGNLIGKFHGLFGENSQSNNFFYWDNDANSVMHHFQMGDEYDCDFWMTTRSLPNEDLIEWLGRLNDHRTVDGFYPTDILYKNDRYTRKDVYEMFDLIDKIIKERKTK